MTKKNFLGLIILGLMAGSVHSSVNAAVTGAAPQAVVASGNLLECQSWMLANLETNSIKNAADAITDSTKSWKYKTLACVTALNASPLLADGIKAEKSGDRADDIKIPEKCRFRHLNLLVTFNGIKHTIEQLCGKPLDGTVPKATLVAQTAAARAAVAGVAAVAAPAPAVGRVAGGNTVVTPAANGYGKDLQTDREFRANAAVQRQAAEAAEAAASKAAAAAAKAAAVPAPVLGSTDLCKSWILNTIETPVIKKAGETFTGTGSGPFKRGQCDAAIKTSPRIIAILQAEVSGTVLDDNTIPNECRFNDRTPLVRYNGTKHTIEQLCYAENANLMVDTATNRERAKAAGMEEAAKAVAKAAAEKAPAVASAPAVAAPLPIAPSANATPTKAAAPTAVTPVSPFFNPAPSTPPALKSHASVG